MNSIEFVFEHEPHKVLAILQESLKQSTVVGIDAPDALGVGIFITSVENILVTDNEPLVVLKEYDASGYILKRNRLSVNEITGVCSFTSNLENPYLKQLTGVRFHRIIK